MDTVTATHELTLELLVRSQSGTGARDKQQALIETLAELEEDGVIDEFVVRVCGSEVCMQMPPDHGPNGESVVSLVSQIQEWAADRGVSIERVFREKTIRSSILEDERTVVRLPQLSLLVFEDESLEAVYPCHQGESFYSVGECVTTLRDREQSPVSSNTTLPPAKY
ncbi:hypothetical protein SAMN04487948_10746 [Halogranum amylolyticum]|uniref:Uncharacterized protein n=1 Tax=Halogranum amylolyticum TaxID=660520 RepID=A0A1H8TGM9_9EURY|nr:HTH domain-containing protein [Halogranum amylolyticum]SEO90279.1 hypothetical protein SAMN04487948_10746 [Halogranum amylolyticum]